MLDDRTRKNLIHVSPPLAHLCYMMDQEGHKFLVPDPPRTKAEQKALYAQGRKSLKEVNALRKAVGMPAITAKQNLDKVTWTLNGKHIIQADGFAHAFDFAPKPVNYENEAAFVKMGKAFEVCAKKLGISIEWGGRWKNRDLPHIESV